MERWRRAPVLSEDWILSDSWKAHRSNKEKKDTKCAGWKDRRWQVKSCTGRLMKAFTKKNLLSSAPYKVTQATFWIFQRLLTPRLRKATHHFCTISGFQEMKILEKIRRRTCARRFWKEQRQEGSVPLTRFATGSETRPEVPAVPPLEETSWFNVCDWSGSGAKFAWQIPNREG